MFRNILRFNFYYIWIIFKLFLMSFFFYFRNTFNIRKKKHVLKETLHGPNEHTFLNRENIPFAIFEYGILLTFHMYAPTKMRRSTLDSFQIVHQCVTLIHWLSLIRHVVQFKYNVIFLFAKRFTKYLFDTIFRSKRFLSVQVENIA